ncbi:uncharacterized mitochondrial protein-like protein [Tanacetum coccineum]
MEGVDYHDTFAPVAKLVTVRTLLAVAVKKEWVINQLDVNNAFLHEDLNEEKDACFVAALIYVDDVIMVGNDVKKIQHTKEELDKRFSIKDLGVLKYFLGIEVARTPEGLVLSQRKYILDILEDCGFQGRLLYLQATRPNIAYSVNMLSQFVADPRHSHMDAAHQVLRYLKRTTGQGILLPRDGGCNLTAYCDSDWLGCPITRRSRTVYLLLLEEHPFHGRQRNKMWYHVPLPKLNTDPWPPRHIANNPVFHERTKHVEMDCYFVRERVESLEIQHLRIHTSMQIADLLTKGLGTQQLKLLLDKLGVRNLHAPT